MAAVDKALASPERALAKAATESVLARYFRGKFTTTSRKLTTMRLRAEAQC
jgi:hypothetical protein